MVMPTLSVTVIGLAVGLVMGVANRRLVATLLWSVAGAWIGFVLGAVVGVVVDVAARTGDGVLIAGHLAAAAGAITAAVRSPRPRTI